MFDDEIFSFLVHCLANYWRITLTCETKSLHNFQTQFISLRIFLTCSSSSNIQKKFCLEMKNSNRLKNNFPNYFSSFNIFHESVDLQKLQLVLKASAWDNCMLSNDGTLNTFSLWKLQRLNTSSAAFVTWKYFPQLASERKM